MDLFSQVPLWLMELHGFYPAWEGTAPMLDVDGHPLVGYGVREERYEEIKSKLDMPHLTPRDASLLVLLEDNRRLTENMEGYADAPEGIKQMILDAAYNTGTKEVLSWRKMKGAVKKGNWTEAVRQTLDTGNITEGGQLKVSKGIVARRIKAANLAMREMLPSQKWFMKISDESRNWVYSVADERLRQEIEEATGNNGALREATVEEDGSVEVRDIKGNIFFQYKAPGGLHSQSIPGEIRVADLGHIRSDDVSSESGGLGERSGSPAV